MTYDIKRAVESVRAEETLVASTSRRLATLYSEGGMPAVKTHRKPRAIGAALVACILVLAFAVYSFMLVPVTYIGVDINPSLELVLNRAGRVLYAQPFNADAEVLLQTVSLRGQSGEQAVASLINAFDASGYLELGHDVTLTVYSERTDSVRLCDTYTHAAQAQLAAQNASLDLTAYPVDGATHNHAQGHGMSAAKYLALMELLEVDDDASFETYSESTLGEIRERTAYCMGQHGGQRGAMNGHRGGGHHR